MVINRHSEGYIFNDSNWMKLYAPVVPSRWIEDQVRKTGKSIDWQNGKNPEDNLVDTKLSKNYLMFYCTELENGKVVTRLKPGSAQPAKGWLRTSPYLIN